MFPAAVNVLLTTMVPAVKVVAPPPILIVSMANALMSV